MRLNGEAYSRRLQEYSNATLQLSLEIDGISKEAALKCSDIMTDSELTEEQVVEKLLEIKRLYSTTKETK
ncbi:MAG: hypothetical protein J6C09_04810 [Clostridia bacterium]|nr:hypothetical protein [Clostridia bacterium]